MRIWWEGQTDEGDDLAGGWIFGQVQIHGHMGGMIGG